MAPVHNLHMLYMMLMVYYSSGLKVHLLYLICRRLKRQGHGLRVFMSLGDALFQPQFEVSTPKHTQDPHMPHLIFHAECTHLTNYMADTQRSE